jgi:hypothetical protein
MTMFIGNLIEKHSLEQSALYLFAEVVAMKLDSCRCKKKPVYCPFENIDSRIWP